MAPGPDGPSNAFRRLGCARCQRALHGEIVRPEIRLEIDLFEALETLPVHGDVPRHYLSKGLPPYLRHDLVGCPDCGAVYFRDYDNGTLEDPICETTAVRLCPTEVAESLGGPLGEAYRAALPGLITALEADLRHANPEVRANAARWLTHHWFHTLDLATLGRILTGPVNHVATVVNDTVCALLARPCPNLPFPPPDPRLFLFGPPTVE